MTPSCPGPGPSPGPATMSGVQPVNPQLIQDAIARGAALYGQSVAKFLGAVQAPLQDGIAATSGLISKFDAAVTAGQAAGQSVIDGLAANFNMTVRGAAALPPGSTTGGTFQQGVTEDQFNYNVYQDTIAPYEMPIEPRGIRPTTSEARPHCFVAGFDNVYDAVAFVSKNAGSPPPDNCPKVGGGTTGTTVPCASALYQTYQMYSVSGDGTQLISGCTVRCSTDPAPPNSIPVGNPVDYSIAVGLLGTPACAISPPTTGGTPPTFNAGCDANKQPVVWDSSKPDPPGIVGKIGPFATQAGATAAAQVICQATGGTGPGGVCCPPPTINVSCPPCPSTGGTSTGGGPITMNVTAKLELPDCLMVDLCDWDKFKQAVYDALCEWYKICMCKLDNEAAYMTSDCDDKYMQQMQGWFGGVGGAVVGATSMDSIVSAGKNSYNADGTATLSDLPW